MIRELHNPSRVLAGKRVLIVDDDIRNIFALTSILERHDVITVSAETGATRSICCKPPRPWTPC